MHVVLLCQDKPDGFQLRADTRAAHLDFLKRHDAMVLAAGPFLDDQGRMTGSLIILDVPDVAAARAFAADDPYARAGLFDRVEIRPWRWAIKPPVT